MSRLSFMNFYYDKLLDYAATVKGDFALLHSSRNDELNNGQKSYLACNPSHRLAGDDIKLLEQMEEGFWVGFIAYELFDEIEGLVGNEYDLTPKICFVKYSTLLTFDHLTKEVSIKGLPPEFEDLRADSGFEIYGTSWSFSDQEYLEKIKQVKDLIVEGEVYEANLTRKFKGKITVDNPFSIYCALIKNSPAQYGAYIKHDDLVLISSSPELFISKVGSMIKSQPIKGTAYGVNHEQTLYSEKNRAENLIIVDLVRNDLSRICEVGTVLVPRLFHTTSYPHLSHLSSLVEGKLKAHIKLSDIILATFPPGSMTGAPKINMYSKISEIEGEYRGIYSGAIGYLNEGDFCLAVAIRTIIIKGDHFEFQVGGAITIDSDPQEELLESKTKAAMILKTLGIA